MILLDTRLDRVKSLKGLPAYDKTLQDANAGLAQKSPVSFQWAHLCNWAIMHNAGEGDGAFGQEGKKWILAIVRDKTGEVDSWFPYDDFYLSRSTFVQIALAAGWLQPLFAADEWADVTAFCLKAAKWAVKNKTWAWDADPNNYCGGHHLLRAVTLPTFPDAELQTQTGARTSALIAYYNGEGRDATLESGMNYYAFDLFRRVMAAICLKEAGIIDVQASTKWFDAAALFRLWSTTPFGTNVLLGDTPQTDAGDFRRGDLLGPLALTSLLAADNPYRGYMQTWLAKWHDEDVHALPELNPSVVTYLAAGADIDALAAAPEHPGLTMYGDEDNWARLLFTDPTLPQGDFSGLPLTIMLPTTGMHMRRSSWNDPKAFYAFHPYGPYLHGHQPAAAGHLGVARDGDWKIWPGANPFAHSGEAVDTPNMNVPMAGVGQVLDEPDKQTVVRLVREDGDVLVVNVRDSFNGQGAVMYDATRMTVWKSDRLVVVWDRFVRIDRSLPVEEHWHALHVDRDPNDLGRQGMASFILDTVKLTVLDPAGGSLAPVVEDILLGPSGEQSSQRLTVPTTVPLVFFFQLENAVAGYDPLTPTVNADGSITLSGGVVIQPPGPTVPDPLPVPSAGGSAPPPAGGGPAPGGGTPGGTQEATLEPLPAAVLPPGKSGLTIDQADSRWIGGSIWYPNVDYPALGLVPPLDAQRDDPESVSKSGLDPGSYDFEIIAAEEYDKTVVGSRLFQITLNDKYLCGGVCDPMKDAGGQYKPVSYKFTADLPDGTFKLGFVRAAGATQEPVVNWITVRPSTVVVPPGEKVMVDRTDLEAAQAFIQGAGKLVDAMLGKV
jgi:hypothetical protein